MKIGKLSDMKGGWMIGNFDPSILKTTSFEVGVHKYTKGQYWAPHFHQHMDEYNYMIRGTMKIKEQIVTEGDYFIISRGEIANPEFITDCEVLIIKTPSVPGDKVILNAST